MRDKEYSSVDDQGIGLLLRDRVERDREVLRPARLLRQEAEAERSGRLAHRTHEVLAGAIQWVPQHCNPARTRRQLVEQLDPFPAELRDHR